MSDSEIIPLIDFSLLSCNVSWEKLDYKAMKPIASEVMEALRSPGFLYLKNSGLTSEEVSTMNSIAEDFFLQPKEVKEKYARGREIERHHGWVDIEYPVPDNPPDLKEGFQCRPADIDTYSLQWPSEQFRSHIMQLYDKLKMISLRFFTLLAVGFDHDPEYFTKCHSKMGGPGNMSLLKCLYYYELRRSDMAQVKEKQLRCSEHSDKGSLTLLISEDITGLQVLTRGGKYLNLSKAEDPSHVLVNLGDIMQRWTDDELIAANHRVVFNDGKTTAEIGQSEESTDDCDPIVCKKRQSIAFFSVPDIGTLIEGVKGPESNYEPILVEELMANLMRRIYKLDE
ncbi:uncharacterized protein LOC142336823 isoform X1 [Convolutriloba macropyga]|uniref:uncharacterized protein LOC142336823 isoform X1 n=1 Tax=Convolutriloba macropyga TaxID=536237 RepID=UPI003F51E86E